MTQSLGKIVFLFPLFFLSQGCGETLACGQGTHQEGALCVPNVDAGPAADTDADLDSDPADSMDSDDESSDADESVDSDAVDTSDSDEVVDAEESPLLREGDPCIGEPGNPDNFVPTCQDGNVFYCEGYPNPQHIVIAYECERYGAECHPAGEDGFYYAHCWGGDVAYRECDGPATPNECYDEVTLLSCNGRLFVPSECDPGEHCALIEGASQPFCVDW